jgi:hypothetical protein
MCLLKQVLTVLSGKVWWCWLTLWTSDFGKRNTVQKSGGPGADTVRYIVLYHKIVSVFGVRENATVAICGET